MPAGVCALATAAAAAPSRGAPATAGGVLSTEERVPALATCSGDAAACVRPNHAHAPPAGTTRGGAVVGAAPAPAAIQVGPSTRGRVPGRSAMPEAPCGAPAADSGEDDDVVVMEVRPAPAAESVAAPARLATVPRTLASRAAVTVATVAGQLATSSCAAGASLRRMHDEAEGNGSVMCPPAPRPKPAAQRGAARPVGHANGGGVPRAQPGAGGGARGGVRHGSGLRTGGGTGAGCSGGSDTGRIDNVVVGLNHIISDPSLSAADRMEMMRMYIEAVNGVRR
uniref:Uncharacterized protein n=1 Tax=Chlamydomonas euryale TaxID=1486919 RepID=A0A7R9V9A0_9CHLO